MQGTEIDVEMEKRKSASAWEQVERDMYLSQEAKLLSIQRVPRSLTENKLELKGKFEPRVVAIGPFHRGKRNLAGAEETKHLIACLFAAKNGTSDDVLRRKILEKIKDLRECYNDQDIEDYYEDEALSWMFLVDGCAVLYAIYAHGYPLAQYRERLLPSFYVDLLLLENQLPYQLLQILVNSTTDPPQWYRWIDAFIYEMAKTVLGGRMLSAPVEVRVITVTVTATFCRYSTHNYCKGNEKEVRVA
ncbi:hypothetical protein V6N11_009479 [Hibiscus sabdariffa]|uniref:Uncharacterized protein n=1 Tax=Hibiscus sabdariffa TaxID=183260 RepID=A0ABR2P5I6_9ROSI